MDLVETIIQLATGPDGVFPNGGQLEVQSIVAGQVIVLDGDARVSGKLYWNDDIHTMDIPIPEGQPRYDMIVVRADYEAQEVRLARIECASPDATIANSLPLAFLQVHSDGSIIVSDMRRMLEN